MKRYFAAGINAHLRVCFRHRRDFLLAVIVIMVMLILSGKTGTAQSPAANITDIGKQRQLFVDDALVSQFQGAAALRLQHPVAREIVMLYDQPWEGSYSNYNSIFRDGDIYRMYYRGWHRGANGEIGHAMVWCYAESPDGIHWKKPDLNLFEFNGSKHNNIVLASTDFGKFHFHLTDNISVFKDQNPDASADARYKALVDCRDPINSLFAFKSADGIHWSPLAEEPILTDGTFDTQNTVFWDGQRKEYRIYWRIFINTMRAIRTATSKDFIHWENHIDLQYSDSSTEQLYTNGIIPYYRAPQIFIGFPARYIDRGWSPSMEALPDLEQRRMRSHTSPRYGTAITESLFMSSRDAVRFNRWNDAFLPPGIEREGTWNYGQQYIGWTPVETKSGMEGAPDELSLYASESMWTGASSALRRYTLRLDGFVSVHAPMRGGGMITCPIRFSGKKLALNFSTSAFGSIRIEIQDAKGNPLPGFSLDDCPLIFGDAIDRTVTWKGDGDLASLAGQVVRLRFEIKDGDLFSFHFFD